MQLLIWSWLHFHLILFITRLVISGMEILFQSHRITKSILKSLYKVRQLVYLLKYVHWIYYYTFWQDQNIFLVIGEYVCNNNKYQFTEDSCKLV